MKNSQNLVDYVVDLNEQLRYAEGPDKEHILDRIHSIVDELEYGNESSTDGNRGTDREVPSSQILHPQDPGTD